MSKFRLFFEESQCQTEGGWEENLVLKVGGRGVGEGMSDGWVWREGRGGGMVREREEVGG